MTSWSLPDCGHLECADHPETCPDLRPFPDRPVTPIQKLLVRLIWRLGR